MGWRKLDVTVRRRSLLSAAGVMALCASTSLSRARAQRGAAEPTLETAPLELGGEWPGSLPNSARRVIARMRAVCLSGVRLLSDQQPEHLKVDNHTDGPPHIWLHDDRPTTAWIIVDIGPRDWCKLAYQFGHELGHVLCNSWKRSASPNPPSQWLEEATVEAFSIRGLGLLAESWQKAAPFAGDEAFAAAIRQYRDNVIKGYTTPDRDMAAWFDAHRLALEKGRPGIEGVAVLDILPFLEEEPACVEDLGALNRWPERTRLPVETYLANWQKSCHAIGASGRLPARIKSLLRLG